MGPRWDVTLETERESKHVLAAAAAVAAVAAAAVRLAARQLTAEPPNRPVTVGLQVSHVTRLRYGEAGLVKRDGGVRLLLRKRKRGRVRGSEQQPSDGNLSRLLAAGSSGRVRRGRGRNARDRLPKQGSKRRVLRWHWMPRVPSLSVNRSFGAGATDRREGGFCVLWFFWIRQKPTPFFGPFFPFSFQVSGPLDLV